MNDPQVLVTNKDNPTGAWIDLTECSNAEEFEDLAIKSLNTHDLEFTISDTTDVPMCYLNAGKLHPYAFEFAALDEGDRTVVFAYSTFSTDVAEYIKDNALNAFWGTSPSREEFAKGWTREGFDLAEVIYDSLDWTKLAQKLEDLWVFVDIASKIYVFHK